MKYQIVKITKSNDSFASHGYNKWIIKRIPETLWERFGSTEYIMCGTNRHSVAEWVSSESAVDYLLCGWKGKDRISGGQEEEKRSGGVELWGFTDSICPGAEVDARSKKLIAADKTLPYKEAMTQVLSADPDLKTAYAVCMAVQCAHAPAVAAAKRSHEVAAPADETPRRAWY